MIQKDNNPALSSMIDLAFSCEYPGNRIPYEKRTEEKVQLLKGIQERADKLDKATEGQIDLRLTLDYLMKDHTAFQRDIDDFIAAKTNGKYQYALRFESLLNYMNHQYNAEISTDFLKKYMLKDADRRRLELLKLMHSELKLSGNSMVKIAENLGVDVKTIREDFNRLEKDFSFLETEINIKGFDKKNKIHNSPVHPVFLALNSTQLYSLLFALKIVANGTVFEDLGLEIANSVYSQLTEFGEELVSDIYQPNDLPEGFKKQFIGSDIYLNEMGKQTILHAAAYKSPCTITYRHKENKITITGIPEIIAEKGFASFLVVSPNGNCIIDGKDVIAATEVTIP
jgi:hypothetical protein